MRIAIIDNNKSFTKNLQQYFVKEEWTTWFFNTSESLLSNMKKDTFDVIIADPLLPGMSGRELLFKLKEDKAELCLMTSNPQLFTESDVKSDHIKNLLKKEPLIIVNKLRYIESKIRIKNLLNKENENVKNMVIGLNGYTFEVQKSTVSIGLNRLLSYEGKIRLYNKIKEANINNAIVSYPNKDSITTRECKELLEISKFFVKTNRKMVFLNSKKYPIINSILKDCKLDKVIPLFEDSKKAIEFVEA